MAVRIRKTGTVTASFATAQQVDISHANDSVNIGDGSNLFGPLQNVGGVLCFPVAVQSVAAGTLATSTKQSDGSQKTQVVDESGNSLDATNVGGNYALKVDVVSSVGGSAAPAFTDDAAATVGTTQCTPIGGLADEVATDSVDEGDVGIVRMTLDRMLYVKVGAALPAGTAAIGKLAANSGVDIGDVDVTSCALPSGASTLAEQQTQTTALGAHTTSLQLIDDIIFVDDAAYTAATHKVAMIGGQYQGTPNALDDGDAGTLLLDASHRLQIVVATALPAGTNAIGKLAANSGVDIGDVDVTSVTMAAANAKVDIGLINAVAPLMGAGNTGTGSLRVTIATDQASLTNPLSVGGPVAVDAAASGNPLINGAVARLTDLPAAQADTAGDVVRILADKFGRLLSGGACAPGAIKYQTTTITASASETTVVTAAGSEIHDIILLVMTNTSATDCIVSLKDSTGGTTRFTFHVPKGGGIVIQPSTPMGQLAAANNNWTITGTSVSSLYVNAMYLVRPS